MVYDIAAFISSRFYEKTTLRLDISEVGYIAMHILGSLQKLSGEDIKIVLVNPYGKAVEKIILILWKFFVFGYKGNFRS